MRFIFEVIFECLLNFDFCDLSAQKKNEGSMGQVPPRPLEGKGRQETSRAGQQDSRLLRSPQEALKDPDDAHDRLRLANVDL